MTKGDNCLNMIGFKVSRVICPS